MPRDLLLSAEGRQGVEQSVARLKGRITHRFADDLLIARFPDSAKLQRLEADFSAEAEASAPKTKSRAAARARPGGKISTLVAKAWAANLESGPGLASTAEEGLSWTDQNFTAPAFNTGAFEADLLTPPLAGDVVFRAAGAPGGGVLRSTGTPTSRYMVGSIALGLVIVSGDSPSLRFTDAEKVKVIEQVQKGANFLATAEPRAQVSFSYDVQDLVVTIGQGPYPGAVDIYEQYEMGWRDEALGKLGYSPGRVGYRAYANALAADQGTRWAYVAFFTKYQLRHFAYAVSEKLVMNYANDNWGPDNIHRVFAHESCHIFGASDEYGSCVCGEVSGELNGPNNNCVNCPRAQVPCLMNANTLQFCKWTKKQIGWDASLFPPSPSAALTGKKRGE